MKPSSTPLNAIVQILTHNFKAMRESVSRDAIDRCSLRALPECVDVSDESHVYITPATTINAAWAVSGISAVAHVQKFGKKKSARFLATSQTNQSAVTKISIP